jgi:hypothetical protein
LTHKEDCHAAILRLLRKQAELEAMCDALRAMAEAATQAEDSVRRLAENMRLSYAPPGAKSFYPYPDEGEGEADAQLRA